MDTTVRRGALGTGFRNFRGFARIAAVVFLINTLYPLITKAFDDRLAGDWAHTLLHFLSAAAAAYVGWFASSEAPARVFVWALLVGYLALGVGGWFIEGLFLGTPFAIPLGPADNIFHLLVGGSAVEPIVQSALPRLGRS